MPSGAITFECSSKYGRARRMADSTLQTKYANAGEASAALAPDAPLFLFSASALRDRATRFLAHFPGRVTYAVKCNPTEPVLHTLSGIGVTAFDVASVHEIELVRRINAVARLHYHNPVKSRREIESAYRYGCRRFAIDCAEEIEKLHAVIGGKGPPLLLVHGWPQNWFSWRAVMLRRT